MNTITPEQIAKLPKWAQEHVRFISMQRDAAVKALNRFNDSQTESPFFVEDHVCSGESSGPSTKKMFIQAYCMSVNWRGVLLKIDANDYGQSGHGIRLQWNGADRTIEEIAFIPTSFQSAKILTKKDMR